MKPLHFFQLVSLAALWAGSFLFTRVSVAEFGPVPLSMVRTLIASAVLMPLLLISKQWPTFKRYWKHIFVVGLISTALPFSLISITTQYTSAGFSSILNSLTPIFSVIIAWLWLKEYLSMPTIIGIGLSFIGVLIMVMDSDSISSGIPILPVLAGLLATSLYGLTGNYSRKFLTGIPPIVIAAGCQFFAALCLFPFALYLWPQTTISMNSWFYAIILGLFCTAIAFLLYFHLLEQIGIAKTVIVTYLIPVIAMAWGNLFLNEAITTKMLFGAVFILTGIALTTGIIRSFKPKRTQ